MIPASSIIPATVPRARAVTPHDLANTRKAIMTKGVTAGVIATRPNSSPAFNTALQMVLIPAIITIGESR